MRSIISVDLLGLDPSNIAEMLNQWGVAVEVSTVKYYLYWITPFAVIGFLLIPFLWTWYRKKSKTKEWRRTKIEEKLRREFSDFIDETHNPFVSLWYSIIGKESKNIFIETKFQIKPPHDKEDPQENVFTEPRVNLIEFYIKKVLVKDNKPKFLYCVLGGSGMGKSTFAVNLVKRYISVHTETDIPYDIFLYSLSNETVMQDIENVAQPESSILILDALDENTEAVKNYTDFISRLEDAIRNFRIVIITCRTQFFANEESEPHKSKLTYYTKGKSFQEYTRHYISVFDNEDINSYIRQKFKSRKKRKSAMRIVGRCSSVLVRPLMLSYIEDLVDYNPSGKFYACDIYSVLIDKWIEREVDFWATKKHGDTAEQKARLHDFSEKLALDIYRNRESRGGLFISGDDFEQFLKEQQFTDPYSYSGRSLVNRDSVGYVKFAHKSFLEYFLALQMFKNGEKISFGGMDVLKEFYEEMCKKEFSTLTSQNKVDSGHYAGSNPVLIVNDTEGYSLDHLNIVDKWRVIMVSWGAANGKLWNWLATCQHLGILVIFNYNGSGSLLPILKLSLDYLYVSGDSIPGKAFVKKMATKDVLMSWEMVRTRQRITHNDIDSIMRHIDVQKMAYNRAVALKELKVLLGK